MLYSSCYLSRRKFDKKKKKKWRAVNISDYIKTDNLKKFKIICLEYLDGYRSCW